MVSKLVGIFRFWVQWLRIDFIATESLVSSKLLSTRSRTGSTYTFVIKEETQMDINWQKILVISKREVSKNKNWHSDHTQNTQITRCAYPKFVNALEKFICKMSIILEILL